MYTAVIMHRDRWWIGWVEEVPGANAQARTRKGLMENLRSALKDIIDINRERAIADAGQDYKEVPLEL